MRTVNIHEAKTHFSELIAAVERGEEIVIARRGVPVAKVSACNPETEPPRRRVFGGLADVARELDPDWWKPTPDDELRRLFGDKYADEVGAP